MKQAGLRAKRKRRFRITTDSKHDLPIAPNLLARNFETDSPNVAWVTDITYIWTAEGWLYLAAVLDLFSRRIVGWATSETISRPLTLDALSIALRTRKPPPGLIHHSDRGCQYASADDRAMMATASIQPGRSRKGNCWDNAVAESFFSTIQAELIDGASFATRARTTAAIDEHIGVFYNPKRRHSHNDDLSPVEFEPRAQIAAEAA